MKLLVFGGHGQLGSQFLRLCDQARASVVAPTRNAIDIRNVAKVHDAVHSIKPDIVVNLTAFHVLEECERSLRDALDVNVASVFELARVSEGVGARFVSISTDYVFDGRARVPYRETDEAQPLQAYGVTKRAGELAALAACSQATIIRTCGIYGRHGSRDRGGNFVEKCLADFATRSILEVGSDLRCTPTSATSLAQAIWGLLVKTEATPGIFHLTADGDCSWAEFAAEIARLTKSSCRVEAIDRRGAYGPVRRPQYSVLANVRGAEVGIRLPHWRDDLARYLSAREK